LSRSDPHILNNKGHAQAGDNYVARDFAPHTNSHNTTYGLTLEEATAVAEKARKEGQYQAARLTTFYSCLQQLNYAEQWDYWELHERELAPFFIFSCHGVDEHHLFLKMLMQSKAELEGYDSITYSFGSTTADSSFDDLLVNLRKSFVSNQDSTDTELIEAIRVRANQQQTAIVLENTIVVSPEELKLFVQGFWFDLQEKFKQEPPKNDVVIILIDKTPQHEFYKALWPHQDTPRAFPFPEVKSLTKEDLEEWLKNNKRPLSKLGEHVKGHCADETRTAFAAQCIDEKLGMPGLVMRKLKRTFQIDHDKDEI
jgi:hypothetical protein